MHENTHGLVEQENTDDIKCCDIIFCETVSSLKTLYHDIVINVETGGRAYFCVGFKPLTS